MNIDPNAPAFPCDLGGPGITVRVYLAGLAMQGFSGSPGDRDYKGLATESIKKADALIAALNKPTS